MTHSFHHTLRLLHYSTSKCPNIKIAKWDFKLSQFGHSAAEAVKAFCYDAVRLYRGDCFERSEMLTKKPYGHTSTVGHWVSCVWEQSGCEIETHRDANQFKKHSANKRSLLQPCRGKPDQQRLPPSFMLLSLSH